MVANLTLHDAVNNYVQYELGQFRDKYFNNMDLICYYGGIDFESIELWKNEIFKIGSFARKREVTEIVVMLCTPGGSAAAVERIVDITRHFYDKVYFIIPSYAMSAGTIWVMSGDKIYMNYASSLGPIDPQVQSSDGKWVPALGYLDKVSEIIEKSNKNTVTQAELMMLSQLDLAKLRQYEQAAELSIDLLKTWLVKYKFKDWDTHRTTNPGTLVTKEEKETRAQEIAYTLNDNSRWHSHGRMISIKTLQEVVKLEIDDFSHNVEQSQEIEALHRFLNDYAERFGLSVLTASAFPCNLDKLQTPTSGENHGAN